MTLHFWDHVRMGGRGVWVKWSGREMGCSTFWSVGKPNNLKVKVTSWIMQLQLEVQYTSSSILASHIHHSLLGQAKFMFFCECACFKIHLFSLLFWLSLSQSKVDYRTIMPLQVCHRAQLLHFKHSDPWPAAFKVTGVVFDTTLPKRFHRQEK